MKYVRDYLYLFTISGLVILLDQWSKYQVRTQLEFTAQWAPWPWLLPYARVVHWNNTGAAFGLFQGMNMVFIILAFIVSGAIIYFFPRVPRQDWMLRLALALQHRQGSTRAARRAGLDGPGPRKLPHGPRPGGELPGQAGGHPCDRHAGAVRRDSNSGSTGRPGQGAGRRS